MKSVYSVLRVSAEPRRGGGNQRQLGLFDVVRSKRLAVCALSGALLTAVAIAWSAVPPAAAESQYCANLRAQIGRASAGGGQKYRAAAASQRAEYSRVAARAAAMHCDRQQFLFFGEPPPPQCAPINARLRSLTDTIGAYDRAALSNSPERDALTARYDAECRNVVAARGQRPRNFFEELFGVAPPDETTGMREEPVGQPDREPVENLNDEAYGDEKPQGGPMAVCVRSCDGGFFPVSYSAHNSNLSDLETLCKALCPNAEVQLYTRSLWKGMEGAVSISGDAYKDHPNAFKFQKSYDPACGCKPPDKSWAEALGDAEAILAERHKKDQMLTAEQAEKLSQPYGPNDPRLKKQKEAPASNTSDQTATEPAPDSGEPGLKPSVVDGVSSEHAKYRDVIGPDGVKRRVRVAPPTL